MYAEGTKSLRHALGRPHGLRWNALKVFNANNRAAIKAEIERKHPEVKGTRLGAFRHWAKYKVICFNALSEKDRGFYAKLADDWNWFGTTAEEKAA